MGVGAPTTGAQRGAAVLVPVPSAPITAPTSIETFRVRQPKMVSFLN